jgi:hypothetical protein
VTERRDSNDHVDSGDEIGSTFSRETAQDNGLSAQSDAGSAAPDSIERE